MARPLRIEYPGALYHVTSRGDRQEAIFDDDQDRTTFLNVLSEVVFSVRGAAKEDLGRVENRRIVS